MSSKSLARSAGSAGQRSGEFVAVAIAVGSDAWCWAVVGWGGVVWGGATLDSPCCCGVDGGGGESSSSRDTTIEWLCNT